MHGIISTYFNDFCWGGSELFRRSVMDKRKAISVVKSEDSANFMYLGLDVNWQKTTLLLVRKNIFKDFSLFLFLILLEMEDWGLMKKQWLDRPMAV